MLLNYQLTQSEQAQNRPTLVFLHGLFGDLNNLGIIARAFSENYDILRVDLRNHGQSFHSDEMNYSLMAQDILTLLESLAIDNAILIGHSMGGKTTMAAAALRPDLIRKLVVIDIAPVNYNAMRNNNEHAQEFAALYAVKNADASTRQQAKPILEDYIQQPATVQFLLKAFDADKPDKTRFNLTALERNYQKIMDWTPVFYDNPTLFIKGGLSDYILASYTDLILAQFPKATSFTINGAHHWVHAEKPEFVVRAITRFLQSN
ncbi:esterase [Pasteurella langaaensis DSM 22999]|uniref:Esterase n=1 Tax=Alitibacter langaaensis DSM 22999 TaxID=1122935 RepID=A0A2U0SKV8_9PAST|nr:alpha/beta fold hydrolase [Pasteurella langaaensis]PVX31969.1 esterase [Pasteurella langaaensis DSM 22999]